MSETQQPKLYLPKFCIVPLQARLSPTLSDGAKIYLGELNALTNKFGYCWASDEELAEMKGVSVRTIKRWHQELEAEGFIKRDTWREHVKDEEKGLIVRSRRKIYVIEEGSNKDAEGPILAPHSEGPNLAPINKEPINKETRARADESDQTEVESDPESNIEDRQVDPILSSDDTSRTREVLSQLDIPSEDMEWIAMRVLKEGRDPQKLVDRVRNWPNRRKSDSAASHAVLNGWEGWRDPEAKITQGMAGSVRSGPFSACDERLRRAAAAEIAELKALAGAIFPFNGWKVVSIGVSNDSDAITWGSDGMREWLEIMLKKKEQTKEDEMNE